MNRLCNNNFPKSYIEFAYGIIPILSLLIFCLSGCTHSKPILQSVPQIESKDTAFEAVNVVQSGLVFSISKPVKPLTILETGGHGGGLIDFNGDSLYDIILLGPDRVSLYQNLGGFRFKDVTADSGIRQKGYWAGVAIGDYDNDGKPDIYVCGYDCSALYHNEGNGKFKEVTAEAGLSVLPHTKEGYGDWRSSAGFADVNNDGKLDLYVCRYAQYGSSSVQLCGDPLRVQKFSCSPDIYTPQIGILYKNLGNGKFQDVTKAMGLDNASGRAWAVAFADYNGDGFIDFAVVNDEKPGDLFENQHGKKFINNGIVSGTGLNTNGHVHGGMGADWGDFNGDGKLDLFIATYQNESKCLYRNEGHGVFTESSLDAGLAESMDRWVTFGSKFLDYDLDGWQDLIVTNGHVINNTAEIYPGTQYRQPVQLFHNNGGVFNETTSLLNDEARKLMVGRALIVGDLNNDGRPDVLITQNEGPVVLLKNVIKTSNHWISLKLKGVKSNRDGFGAHVVISVNGKKQVMDASSSGSFLSSSDPRLLFGIGAASSVDSIEIHWLGGSKQTWKNVEANHRYEIEEGNEKPTLLTDATLK